MKLTEVAEAIDVSKDLISKGWIEGPDGLVSVNEDGELEVWIKSTPKKQWPWIAKKLSFMKKVHTNEKNDCVAKTTTIKGIFILDRLPTPDEAETIRKETGLRKARIALPETNPKTGV
jgi:hypothetical protein